MSSKLLSKCFDVKTKTPSACKHHTKQPKS